MDYLGTQVELFLEGDPVMPDTNWRAYLQMRRVSYSGEMMLKGLPLTWRQMLPALPPAEVSGSVDATALASRGLRPYLKKPELSIKQAARAVACAYGRCACGPSLRSGNTLHIARAVSATAHSLSAGRSAHILERDATLERRVWRAERRPQHAGLQVADVTLRFIVNLQPSNDLQNVIVGDMCGMPLFTQWTLCELMGHECYHYSGEDEVAAFYLYRLSAAWLAWFVLGRAATAETLATLQLPADAPWPALCVIPMGWVSATGIMQHLALRLCLLSRRALPVAEALPEASRQAVAAVSRELRVSDWADAFVDDHGQGEIVELDEAVTLEGVPSQYQLALRHVFAEWGVARSTKKAIQRSFVMLTRGARLDGREGRATPSTDKLIKFIGVTWMLLGDAYITWQDVAAVGGLAVFLYQFRRCAFVAVEFLRGVMYNLVERRERWPCVATDLLVTVFLLPLLVIDFRFKVSGLVSCSDASEDGAGVCAARGLTAAGGEAYHRAAVRCQPGAWLLGPRGVIRRQRYCALRMPSAWAQAEPLHRDREVPGGAERAHVPLEGCHRVQRHPSCHRGKVAAPRGQCPGRATGAARGRLALSMPLPLESLLCGPPAS